MWVVDDASTPEGISLDFPGLIEARCLDFLSAYSGKSTENRCGWIRRLGNDDYDYPWKLMSIPSNEKEILPCSETDATAFTMKLINRSKYWAGFTAEIVCYKKEGRHSPFR